MKKSSTLRNCTSRLPSSVTVERVAGTPVPLQVEVTAVVCDSSHVKVWNFALKRLSIVMKDPRLWQEEGSSSLRLNGLGLHGLSRSRSQFSFITLNFW